MAGAAMSVLAFVVVASAGAESVGMDAPTNRAEAGGQMIGMVMVVVAYAILAWRIHRAPAVISASLLLVMLSVEVLGRLTGGTLNAGWAVFWACLILGGVNGFRGALARRRFAKAEPTAEAA